MYSKHNLTTAQIGTCVIYGRVSPRRKDPDAALSKQVQQVEEQLQQAGIVPVAVYTDRAIDPAPIEKRPGLIATLEAIESGSATTIAISALYTFGGCSPVVHTLIERLQSANATIYIADDHSHTSLDAETVYFWRLMAASNDWERASVSARLKSCAARKKKATAAQN